MTEQPQTWHYGLIARYWAEFNDDFRPHEIPYFRRFVEDARPAGARRRVRDREAAPPVLRAGLDVDGCDVSADMVALCREKAEREGLSPTLYVQPMHELDMPRRYRTIYVCGAFGLGSTRSRTSRRSAASTSISSPAGTLLLDAEVPYADPRHWKYWLEEGRSRRCPSPRSRRERGELASDGAEYTLRSRLPDVRPARPERRVRDGAGRGATERSR